jgi:hypothetical protein
VQLPVVEMLEAPGVSSLSHIKDPATASAQVKTMMEGTGAIQQTTASGAIAMWDVERHRHRHHNHIKSLLRDSIAQMPS